MTKIEILQEILQKILKNKSDLKLYSWQETEIFDEKIENSVKCKLLKNYHFLQLLLDVTEDKDESNA